ncbi:MAG: serine/threonine-protein kinase [Byssovorax sp.]
MVESTGRSESGGDAASSRPDSAAATGGKYRFIAALGHGGMADVYLAVAVGPAGFNKLLVIKRLRQSLEDQPELRAMFLDEARLAARLNHRNVVQTNEVGMVDDQYFIAMEYLDGQPLNRVFARARQEKRTVPLGISLHILCDVLAGLQYAHDLADYDGSPLHVVHRDVSPQNVFVTYDGQTKIVDFGIAKAARRMVETQAGVIKGKVSYMAPEQAFSSSAEVDRRADVFSVGVMLWESIAGRRLWQGLGDPEIIGNMLKEMPRVREVVPDVLPELADISERALARDRDARYPSAAALRIALESCIEKLGPRTTTEEVGAYVREVFAAQRAELRSVIDRQLAALDETPETRRESSTIRPTPLPEIRASIPPDDDGFQATVSRRTPGQGTPTPTTVPSGPSSARTSTLLGAVLGSEPAPPLVATPSRTPLFAAISVAIIAAGAAAGLLAARKPTPPHAELAVASDAPAPSAVSSTAAERISPVVPDGSYLRARISVNPAEARILLDGAPLPENPFEGKFMKDGAVHRMQFEAAGFLPQSRLAVFDKDLSLDIALQLKPKNGGEGKDPPAGSAMGAKPDPYGLSPR